MCSLSSTKVAMDKQEADAALFAFADVADRLKLDWFLVAGTCLGLYRDGKYLPGDNDIDVGVLAKHEQLQDLWWELYQAGFKIGRHCENADGTKNRHTYYKKGITWPDEGGVLVDVFYAFTEDELNLIVNFGQIEYSGRDFLVPHPVQMYLQLTYGEWWDKSLRNQAIGKEGVDDNRPLGS